MARTNNSLSLKRLFLNRKFTVTISVILAVIIWFVVVIERNPTRERTFDNLTVNVAVDSSVSDMGLGIITDVSSAKFRVTVSGPNYLISSLRADDFSLNAVSSSGGINEAGVRTLKVECKQNSDKTGYNFISVYPETIDVAFDYFDTKIFTVIPKIDGAAVESNNDNLIADTEFVVGNSDLEISGPRSIISKIDSVTAYAKVDKKIIKTESFNADLYLRDADGNTIYRYAYGESGYTVFDRDGNVIKNNYLTISNNTVISVTRPISKKVTLKVKPQFKDIPSGIKQDSISYSVDNKTVTVVGTPDIVSEMDALYLQPISFNDIGGTARNVTFEVLSVLPDGVRIAENIEKFTVTVNTASYNEKSFTVSNVKATNLQSGLSVTTAGKIVNVKICGPSRVISSIKSTDLYAEIDLTGKSEGQYSLTPIIKSQKYNNIWVHGNVGEITVTVK